MAMIAVVAFGLRLAVLARGGGAWSAIEYDDGVHYGAAALLLHGVLPYRDQVFLQPPGIAVLLLPFAVVGRAFGEEYGLAAARVATCAVGAATTWLLGRLVAREVGTGAGLCAAAVYAGSSSSLLAESTVLLEPYLNLFAVLSLDQLARWRGDCHAPNGRAAGPARSRDRGRRVLVAGACMGLAGAVKLWAVAPFVASLGSLLVVSRHRDAARFTAAAAGAVAVVAGPFLLVAPTSAVRDVVFTQATRPSAGTASRWTRVLDMSGLAPAAGPGGVGAVGMVGAAAVLVAVLLLAGLAVRRSPLARLAGAQLGLTVLMFLVSRPYFSHYADFLVPPVAILVGVGIAEVAQIVRGRRAGGLRGRRSAPAVRAPEWAVRCGATLWRNVRAGGAAILHTPRPTRRCAAAVPADLGGPTTVRPAGHLSVQPGLAAVLATGLAAVLSVAVAAGQIATALSLVRPAAVSPERLRAALPGGCVLTDQPVLAVYADSFAADCPAWLDPRGTGLTELRGRSPERFYPYGFRALPGWQQHWRNWAGRADAAVLTGAPCAHAEWQPQICRYVTEHFELVAVVGRATPNRLSVQVWVRHAGDSPTRPVANRASAARVADGLRDHTVGTTGCEPATA